MNRKRRIVISAVNCVEGGILSVLQDCVTSICAEYGKDWDIFVLANSRKFVPKARVRVFEFPKAKKYWTARLIYEYVLFRNLSKRLGADVWLSLHDISGNVRATRRVVYCHNPNPFYPLRLHDAIRNWKFAAFSLFYGYIYRINIHSNTYVVVQQEWLRKEFERRYKLNNVIVAHPEGVRWSLHETVTQDTRASDLPYQFFYPFVPRFFKNAEVICKAARILYERGERNYLVTLTLDGTENKYAKSIRNTYGDLPTIAFVGRLPRDQVFNLYSSSDCLIFASKLETWGLPITEFKLTGRPILVVDFPYSRETVGSYNNVGYFDADDENELASKMSAVISGEFKPAPQLFPSEPRSPYAANWSQLWSALLKF